MKLSKYLPLEIIKTLYYSLINPFLLCGIEVWHGTYANITNKILILQKKECKVIHSLPVNTHTTEYFKNANILKLESQISKHMFKCLNVIAHILPKHSDIHNYPTRNNNKFIAPKCNMRKSEMSMNFKSIKVWNKLPADIRKGKGKVFHGQEPPSGESTTTECRVNYQLLAVMY